MADEPTMADELTTTVDGEAEDPIDTVEGAVVAPRMPTTTKPTRSRHRWPSSRHSSRP